tara:strand:+ start:401 stop:589 length:189 start_codon:yes stop_codon:yes gene_type:complete
MGKMKKIAELAMSGKVEDEKQLFNILSSKMSKGAAKIGVSEFIKAAQEMKKEMKIESDSTEL